MTTKRKWSLRIEGFIVFGIVFWCHHDYTNRGLIVSLMFSSLLYFVNSIAECYRKNLKEV